MKEKRNCEVVGSYKRRLYMDIIQALTQELQVEKWQVGAAVKLID